MKTNSTFTIIFFTRKSSSTADKLSIYARITVDGQRSEISLKRSVLVNDWDNNRARCRGNTTKVRFLNSYLDEVYNQILDCHKQLFQEGKMISANAIKGRFLDEDDSDATKLKYGFFGEVILHSILKVFFGTQTFISKGYFYNPLENSESKDYSSIFYSH